MRAACFIEDNLIAEGKALPMIIVMPNNQIVHRSDPNHRELTFKVFENELRNIVIPLVEKNYSVSTDRHKRAIAGLSMGGGGTFMYALHHPELFSSACPLSAYCGPLSIEELARPWEKQLDGLSDDQKQKYFARHSALELIKAIPDDQKKAVRWYIDCGDDDFLYEGNCLVHIAMRKKDIPHEFRIRDGVHSWTYWREALPTVLEFVSQSFHQY